MNNISSYEPYEIRDLSKRNKGGLWGRNLGQGGVSIIVYKKYINY